MLYPIARIILYLTKRPIPSIDNVLSHDQAPLRHPLFLEVGVNSSYIKTSSQSILLQNPKFDTGNLVLLKITDDDERIPALLNP